MDRVLFGPDVSAYPDFLDLRPEYELVYVYDFIGGFATAGFQQSMFNRLLEIVPEQGRQRAIAIYTTLSQISAIFCSPRGHEAFFPLCLTKRACQ